MRLQSLKPSIRFLLSGLIFFVLHVPVKSQQADPILSYFTAIISGSKIQLNWAIAGGNTCDGTIVQRLQHGSFFETIGEIGGVCGSPDFEIPYFFFDENPLPNKVNFYRLELGSQGYSSAIEIEFIPLNKQGYSLRYDTQNKSAVINFENSRRNTAKYQLYSISGQMLQSGFTTESKIILSLQEYATQLLIFNLLLPDQEFKIKILHP